MIAQAGSSLEMSSLGLVALTLLIGLIFAFVATVIAATSNDRQRRWIPVAKTFVFAIFTLFAGAVVLGGLYVSSSQLGDTGTVTGRLFLLPVLVIAVVALATFSEHVRWLLLVGVGVLVVLLPLFVSTWKVQQPATVGVVKSSSWEPVEVLVGPESPANPPASLSPQSSFISPAPPSPAGDASLGPERPAAVPLVEVIPVGAIEPVSPAPAAPALATGVPLVEVTPQEIVAGGALQEVIEQQGDAPLEVVESSYDAAPSSLLPIPTSRTQGNPLPHWVQGPNQLQEGEFVFHSERFSTIAEAQSQLLDMAQGKLQPALAQRSWQMQNWRPTMAQVLSSGVVQRQCIATYPLQVGEFTETVYEVSWSCQFADSEAKDRLQAMWQAESSQNRVYHVAAALLAMTVGLFLVGTWLVRVPKVSAVPGSTS